ncbi:hypothetical protein DIPPA_21058 [Diplonema papillatum]|nr:hypothetical protein DIPPA_21058 [Diplonema papillatum]
MASPHAALRISLLTRACMGKGITQTDEEYPLTLHPVQAPVRGSHDLGAVVFNSVIAFVVYLLFLIAVPLSIHLDLLPSATRDPDGFLRFPSIPLFIWQFLYLGTAFGAARLIFRPSFEDAEYIGGTVLLICMGLPLLISRWVRSGVPAHAVYEPVVDPCGASKKGTSEPRALTWLLGPGEWVSRSEYYDWERRYGSLTRSLRPGRAWYASVECLTSLLLAVILAIEPSDMAGCGHIRMACAGVFFTRILLDSHLAPFVKQFQAVTEVAMHAIQGVGLVIMAIAFYADSHPVFLVGDTVLLVASVALIVKMVLEGAGEGFVLCMGRREKLRARVFEREREAASDAESVPEEMLTHTPEVSLLHGTVPSPFTQVVVTGGSCRSLAHSTNPSKEDSSAALSARRSLMLPLSCSIADDWLSTGHPSPAFSRTPSPNCDHTRSPLLRPSSRPSIGYTRPPRPRGKTSYQSCRVNIEDGAEVESDGVLTPASAKHLDSFGKNFDHTARSFDHASSHASFTDSYALPPAVRKNSHHALRATK